MSLSPGIQLWLSVVNSFFLQEYSFLQHQFLLIVELSFLDGVVFEMNKILSMKLREDFSYG